MKYPSYLKIVFAIFLGGITGGLVIPTVVTYTSGEVPQDKLVCEAIEKNKNLGIHVNPYTSGIIVTIGKMPYVTPTPSILIFFKYRISGVGYLPYWYKSSKKLDSLFSTLPPVKEPTTREKLGI